MAQRVQLRQARATMTLFLIHRTRQDARRLALHFGKHYRWIDPATTIEDTELSIACPIPLT